MEESYTKEADRLEAPHGEKVRHHGGKAWSKAALSDETQLQLRQTDHIIALLPVPRRYVKKIGLELKK